MTPRAIALCLVFAGCIGGGEPEPERPRTYDTFDWAVAMSAGDEARLSLSYTLTTTDPAPTSALLTRMYGEGNFLSGHIDLYELANRDDPLDSAESYATVDLGFEPREDDGRHFISARIPVPLKVGTHELHLGMLYSGNELDVSGKVDVEVQSDDVTHQFEVLSAE